MWRWGALWLISKPLCTAFSHHPELPNRVTLRVFSFLGCGKGAVPLQVPPGKGLGHGPVWCWTQVFRARVEQDHPRVFPLASHTAQTGTLSLLGEQLTHTLGQMQGKVSLLSPTAEWLKNKKIHHSVAEIMTTHSSLFWSKSNFFLPLFPSLCFPIWWELVSQLGARSVCYWFS